MNDLTEYIIPFSGLKIGHHNFTFKIQKTFFDAFEYSEIKNGNLVIELALEKSETMMIAHFDIEGDITLECDSCLGDVIETVSTQYRQIYKFTDDEDLNLTDEMTHVSFREFEIDTAPLIIEFINLCKPNKVNHKEGECNAEFTNMLDEYLLVEEHIETESNDNEEDEGDLDPRWNALSKLKNKQ